MSAALRDQLKPQLFYDAFPERSQRHRAPPCLVDGPPPQHLRPLCLSSPRQRFPGDRRQQQTHLVSTVKTLPNTSYVSPRLSKQGCSFNPTRLCSPVLPIPRRPKCVKGKKSSEGRENKTEARERHSWPETPHTESFDSVAVHISTN